jgi:hypothetical protein
MTTMMFDDCQARAYGPGGDRRSRPAYIRGLPACMWQVALRRHHRAGRRTET